MCAACPEECGERESLAALGSLGAGCERVSVAAKEGRMREKEKRRRGTDQAARRSDGSDRCKNAHGEDGHVVGGRSVHAAEGSAQDVVRQGLGVERVECFEIIEQIGRGAERVRDAV